MTILKEFAIVWRLFKMEIKEKLHKLNGLSKERMEILLELSKMKEKRIKFNQQLLILDKKIGLLIEK